MHCSLSSAEMSIVLFGSSISKLGNLITTIRPAKLSIVLCELTVLILHRNVDYVELVVQDNIHPSLALSWACHTRKVFNASTFITSWPSCKRYISVFSLVIHVFVH
jgi:hypothetical protein